jgi:Uncharacterised nucleotidyltransferase
MPDATQELVLRAAVMPSPDAVDAWRQLTKIGALERLDPASRTLLPLVYLNLRGHDAGDPGRNLLSEAYRGTWMRNQQMVHQGRKLLEVLHAADVDTVLLKGASVIMLDYASVGARPMADLDVLVRPEKVAEALEALSALGRRPAGTSAPARLDLLHADTFPGAGAPTLEVHWRTIEHREPEEDLWRHTVPTDFAGVPTRSLCATDRLLHVCVHGLTPSEPPALRWVTDALAIMGRHEVDWPRLLDQARRREVTLPMSLALGYLQSRFEADVPAAVLHDLERTPRSRVERAGYAAAIGPWDLRGVLRWYWFLCRRVTPSRTRAILAFPRYLRLHLGYDRRRDFARYAWTRVTRGPLSARGGRAARHA